MMYAWFLIIQCTYQNNLQYPNYRVCELGAVQISSDSRGSTLLHIIFQMVDTF